MRLRLTPLLLLAATGLPGVAWAQTDIVVQPNQPTIQIASGAKSAFNQADCQDPGVSTAVVYNFPTESNWSFLKLEVFATESNTCPDTAGSNDVVLVQKTTITMNNRSDTENLFAKDLLKDCPDNTTKTFHVCAVSSVQQQDYNGTITEKVAYKESVAVDYDSVQPAKPVIKSSTAGDRAISFEWAGQDDIDYWIIYYRPNGPAPANTGDICSGISSSSAAMVVCDPDAGCREMVCDPDAGCTVPPDAAAPGPDAGPAWDASPPFDPSLVGDGSVWSSVTIEDGNNGVTTGEVEKLMNDQQYQFVLVAVDLAGNVSTGSDPVNATPVVVHDFYRRYQCSGGNEKGGFGCSSTGMAVLVPAAGLAVLALIRRRRLS